MRGGRRAEARSRGTEGWVSRRNGCERRRFISCQQQMNPRALLLGTGDERAGSDANTGECIL